MIRTALAAGLIPLAMLTAAPAHATARGLDVSFEPLLGGLGVRVEVADTTHAGKQNCAYNSSPETPNPFLQNFHKDFVLGLDGVTSWQIPAIATGTLWRVDIRCSYSPPPVPANAPTGLFNDTVTY